VSAWAHDQGIVLGEVKTAEKSNEITAIPELLKLINIKGCTVTIDAMGCQRSIAQKIIKKEGDYVLALKGNHSLLHEEIVMYFDDAQERKFKGIDYSYFETRGKNHGRQEHREYWVTEDIEWITPKKRWAGLRSIGMVASKREVKGEVSEENRYYLSSLPAEAEEFARAVRGHWRVENCLHWVLDIAFREDDCRVRAGHAPENFTILRHFALNLLKSMKSHKGGIKTKRMRAGWDNKFLGAVLAKI
jgi:predicted transposase YbfD/YdcC